MNRFHLTAGLCLAWALSGLPVCGDETESQPPAVAEPSVAEPAVTEPAAKDAEPEASPRDEAIDKELEESLHPPDAQQKPGEVLDRAVNQMRDVSQRIEAGLPGQETQQLQQKVLDDLTQLIELLQNQPPPPPPNPNNQPPPPQNDKKPKPHPKSDTQQQQEGQQQKREQQEQTERRPKDGQDSEERFDESQAEKARAAAARKRMLKDIWGHLPEAIRNRLLNNFSEEYLPKYAPEVRKYYEDLGQRRSGGQNR
ncbi:hypothetical protein CA54_38950 [Symmachiella macrocystis]|uniref:Uncharacterized protein n=1 Tax=Symmachiella macrocystis TaxID=2527985 RepID=A0A5C6BBL2_9PLAN|nr:hypothetical protein [Symmachiella macrocystis]TWU08659.1 hypothetical protein CA54_38950 [Symmachiella macrocystis]